jgi:hypothetical protein
MGTKVMEMQKVATRPEFIATTIGDLLNGRNVSSDMYDKYVVGVEQDGSALRVEIDDGSFYTIEVLAHKK